MLNEFDISENEKRLLVRNSDQIIEANRVELYPYPVTNKSYRIIPRVHSDELERRTISIIDRNLASMVKDCEKYKGPISDDKVTLFYGLQAYDMLINFLNFYMPNTGMFLPKSSIGYMAL